MRDLDQNPGAVTRFRVASAGAAVRQINEDLNAFAYDFMGLLAIEVDHESHPAGVVLVTRIVEALARRRE